MDFHTLKRKQLQALCKENGIPANLKNVDMAHRLALHFKGKKGKSCLKIVETDDEKQESKEEKKKVRFSPQNEMFEFERTDPREMRLMGRKRRSIALLKEGNVRGEENGEGEKKNLRRRKSVVSVVVEKEKSLSELSVCEEGIEGKMNPERRTRRKSVVGAQVVAVPCEEKAVEMRKPVRFSRRKSVVRPDVEKELAVEVCEEVDFEGNSIGKDKPVEDQPRRILRSRVRKRHFEDQHTEVKSSPVGRKAMRGGNRHESADKGAAEGVTRLADKTNDGSEKPFAVGRTRRQLKSQEVISVDSTEGDKDSVVQVPEKKKLKMSESVVVAPRKSARQMKKTKADEGILLSEGQGDKQVLDDGMSRNSEDGFIEVVPDKRKRKGEKNTSTVIEKEVSGTIYEAKSDQHVSIEKTVVEVVENKHRGRKAATKKSGKQITEADMDVQNDDLKRQNKTSKKDDSKMAQVARRSTRQAVKNKVDSSVCEDVMDDISCNEEATICVKEKTHAIGSISCNEEIAPTEATLAYGSPDDKEIERKDQYEIPGGFISLEHKVELSERVIQSPSGSSPLLCEVNDTTESAECGKDNLEKPSENVDCDAGSSANDGQQCLARRGCVSEEPKAEMVVNLILVSANSSEVDLTKSEDYEEENQCIEEGTNEAGSDAPSPPNNEVSGNLLLHNDGFGEANRSVLANVSSGVPLELRGTGTYYSDEEIVATPQSIETRESNDKPCSFIAEEHCIGPMDSSLSRASQNEHFSASATPELSNLASLEKTEVELPEQQDVAVVSTSYNNELQVTASPAPELSNLAGEADSEAVTDKPITMVQSTRSPNFSSLSGTEHLIECEETKTIKPEVGKIIYSSAEIVTEEKVAVISETVVGESNHSSTIMDGYSAVASVATASCKYTEESETTKIATPLEAQKAGFRRSNTEECGSCKFHNDAATETMPSHESSFTPYLQYQADVDCKPIGSETKLEECFRNMSSGDLAAMSVEDLQTEQQALACQSAPVEESVEGASCSEISPKSGTIMSFNAADENGHAFRSSGEVSVGCEADVFPFTPPRVSSSAINALMNRFESPETTKERETVLRNCHSALNQEVHYEVFKGSFDASSAEAKEDSTCCTTMKGLALDHSENEMCLDLSIEKQLSEEHALKNDTEKLESSEETHVGRSEKAAKDDSKDQHCGEKIEVNDKPSSSAVCYEKGIDMPFTTLEVNSVELDGAGDSCCSPGSFSSQEIPLSNRFSVLGQRISYEVFGESCFSEAKKDFVYNTSDNRNFLTRQESKDLIAASNGKQFIDECGNVSSKVDVNEPEQENQDMKSLEFDLLWEQIFNDVVEESRVEAPTSNLSVNDYEGNINDPTILDPQNDILEQLVSSQECHEVKLRECPHQCDTVEGNQSIAELNPKQTENQPNEVVKESLEVQNERAVPEDPMKSYFAKDQKLRSILIHGTPQKPSLFTHDMKENALAPKVLQMADVTAVKRMGKRKALKSLL